MTETVSDHPRQRGVDVIHFEKMLLRDLLEHAAAEPSDRRDGDARQAVCREATSPEGETQVDSLRGSPRSALDLNDVVYLSNENRDLGMWDSG